MRKQYGRLATVMSVCVLALVACRAATSQITVTTANPNNALQGTTALNVTVAGGGFETGAQATWFVSGTTNTGGVVVNSTTFVSSTQLVANITVANTATTGSYDIAVKNSNGRTGVGSDAFTINPMAVTSTLYSTSPTGAAVTVEGDSSSGVSAYDNDPSSCALFDPHDICTIESLLPNDWYLRFNSSSPRTIHLTFVALGNSPNESVLDGYYSGAGVVTRCFDASNNRVSIPLTIPFGTSNNHCSFRVNFVANGAGYTFAMGPTFSGTGWSTVGCKAHTSTESCSEWSITPTPGNLLPNSSLAGVATLYVSTKKGQILIGTYEMTFNVTLAPE